MSETAHQKELVKWFSANYPEIKSLLFSIPNGANFSGAPDKRKFGQINKLKAEGMKSGVPDLMLALPFNGYAGLFIEMKDQGKTKCSVSKEQAAYLEALTAAGYFAVWAAGFEVARDVIIGYLNGYKKQLIH